MKFRFQVSQASPRDFPRSSLATFAAPEYYAEFIFWVVWDREE